MNSCETRENAVMNWQALKIQLTAAAKEFTDCGGTLDVLLQSLLDFIPSDPNKAADAEWLKERGWEKTGIGCLAFKDADIRFYPDSIDYRWLLFKGNLAAINPSRMMVALFEAAAREAVAK